MTRWGAVWLALAAAAPAAGQGGAFDAALARFDSTLAAHVAADGVGSIAAAVVVGDSVIWSRAYGVADRGSGARATDSTLYRAGSISKSITAVVLMRLVELGVVSLDQPVSDHLPELDRLANLRADARPITYRDLASHTAGLEREPRLIDAARGPLEDWDRKVIASLPMTAVTTAPGASYSYSNIGYGVLGLALERAAGTPFIALVERLVFAPAGMTSSTFVVSGRERARLATGYVNRAHGLIDPRVPAAEHRGRGYKVPNGGVYATAADLARFIAAVSGARGEIVLADSSRFEMFRIQTPGDARSGYGLGFRITEFGGVRMAGHSGSVAGYAAYMVFDPETRIGVVLMRNYNDGATNLGRAGQVLLLDLVRARRGGWHPPGVDG